MERALRFCASSMISSARLPCWKIGQQEGLDRGEEVRLVVLRDADAEGLGHRAQQVVGLELRADDLRGDDHLRVEFLQQRAHERGLAGADLAGDDEEALALVDAVLQVRVRALVPLAAEVEGRVGTELEGLARQAVEVFVHAVPTGGGTARRRRRLRSTRCRRAQRWCRSVAGSARRRRRVLRGDACQFACRLAQLSRPLSPSFWSKPVVYCVLTVPLSVDHRRHRWLSGHRAALLDAVVERQEARRHARVGQVLRLQVEEIQRQRIAHADQRPAGVEARQDVGALVVDVRARRQRLGQALARDQVLRLLRALHRVREARHEDRVEQPGDAVRRRNLEQHLRIGA